MRKLFLVLAAVAALFCGSPTPRANADLIKQSSTYNRTVVLVSTSDHVTGLTGQSGSVVVIVSKNGGAEATITPTVTEIGHGKYNLALTTTHTNTLGALDLYITATGGDPSDFHDQVVAFDPNDGAAFGLSRLDASISSRLSAAASPANWSAMVISSGGIVSSLVTGYSSGQDPATLVLAATVDGSLTVKQSHALAIAVLTGKYSIARDTVAKTITVTYKRADGTTLLATLVTSYSDTGLTLATGRTITYSSLP